MVSHQAPKPNNGFRDALSLMRMDGAAEEADDEECSITPVPKKPRLSDQIAMGLEITPPPVVGMQSEFWFDLQEVLKNNRSSIGKIIATLKN